MTKFSKSNLYLTIAIFSSAILFSCSSNPHLLVKKGATFDTLYVNYQINQFEEASIASAYERGITNALNRFNNYSYKKFVAVASKGNKQPALNLNIHETSIATKEQQTGAIVGSVIGLSIPFILVAVEAPIILFFWFNSANQVHVVEGLSKDIKREDKVDNYSLTYKIAGGWFRSEEKNIQKTGDQFGNLLYLKLKNINQSIKH